MRKISFRYNLLREGAHYAQLFADESSVPVIRMDDGGAVKMSFSGVFAPYARDADRRKVAPNWLTDEIQPVLRIDGAEHPLGIFLPATIREEEQDGLELVKVDAYDRGLRVRDTNSAELLYWPAGTLYLDAVEQLLTAAGIQTVFKTPNAAELAEAREGWEPGVSYLAVANELLAEINYKPVWFSETGIAMLEPAAVPDASAIRHRFDSADRETRMVRQLGRETDIWNAPNVFHVTCANPEKDGLMSATAVNDNPQSPLSTVRRGRRICRFEQVNNIADQAALNAYAEKLRNDSMISGETITVTTGLRFGFGVDDVVGIHYGDLTAIGIERGFEMRLEVGGRMTHRIERVVYNLE